MYRAYKSILGILDKDCVYSPNCPDIAQELGPSTKSRQIARQLGITAQTVKKWRSRWLEKKDRIEGLSLKEIETQIRNTLSDRAGRGAPIKFTAEQVCQIIAVACEPPEQSGRPVTQWTPKQLTEEVIKREIVTDISTTQVSNFLKRGRLKSSSWPVLA